MAIQWDGLNSSPNIFALGMQGYETGRKIRNEREVRQATNVFAQDPDKGTDALIAAGRPDLAAASTSARRSQRVARAEKDASASAASGDYASAARAAAGSDIGTAGAYQKFGDDQMDHLQKAGERSARIIMSASTLPTPQARTAYIAQHSDELAGMGYTPEQIASYDTTDETKMRADAARFMTLSEIAGKRDVQRLGDFAVVYDTDPVRGTRAVSKTAIPPTRAEQRQQAEFDWRKTYDERKLALDAQAEERRAQAAGNPDSSPSKVVGPLYRKLVNGEALSTGEKAALNYYKLDPMTARAVSGAEDDGSDEYARPGGAAPPPNGTRRPTPPPGAASAGDRPPPRALSALQENVPTTFANGQVWALKNGQPVRVK